VVHRPSTYASWQEAFSRAQIDDAAGGMVGAVAHKARLARHLLKTPERR
jgi:hypothetical protein